MICLQHSKIDFEKWDATAKCLSKPYIQSWYLNAVSKNWKALVVGDYELIFPLMVSKKWGISFLVQPPFCQQTGLVGDYVDSEIEHNCIDYINKHFIWSYWQGNSLMKSRGDIQKSNYILPLQKSYSELYQSYKGNHKRNTKKYHNSGSCLGSLDEERACAFIRTYARFSISVNSWGVLSNVLNAAYHQQCLKIVASFHKSIIESVSIFLFSANTIVHIASASTADGYKHSAQYGIINSIIEQFAQTDYMLDFEGSSIPSIAYFNQGFGAQEELFPCFQNSKIPFL